MLRVDLTGQFTNPKQEPIDGQKMYEFLADILFWQSDLPDARKWTEKAQCLGKNQYFETDKSDLEKLTKYIDDHPKIPSGFKAQLIDAFNRAEDTAPRG